MNNNQKTSSRPDLFTTGIHTLRQAAINIFDAGIRAADPYPAVKQALRYYDSRLEIANGNSSGERVRTGHWRRIYPTAFGKAACAMSGAVGDVIPAEIFGHGKGIAVTNYENVTEVDHFTVIGAAHPLPDQSGLEAAQRIAAYVRNANSGDLVLVLISGGGSALLPLPPENIPLQDKVSATDLLLSCGADITQINCVRKHLSQIKGGGLARLAGPADLHALILSDVVGDDLSSIASGPAVPDPTTFEDAASVFKSRGIWEKLPPSIKHRLEEGCAGNIAETPKPGDKIFASVENTLIGSNRISIAAIAEKAHELGFDARIHDANLCGEARVEGEKLARHMQDILSGSPPDQPIALLAGGETTVTLTGNGKGGRNQEMALAFALAAQSLNGDWVFLSGGTDGRDGPTDAAGGIVDPGTLTRTKAAGVDALARLEDNDSHTALEHAQDLLKTGATGTNVADLQILLINP